MKWATSSSLEMPVYLHHGPIRAFRSAEVLLTANYAGPRDTLVTRVAAHCIPDGPKRANCLTIAVHEVGPCEGLFTRSFAAVCRHEIIRNIITLSSRANTITLIGRDSTDCKF